MKFFKKYKLPATIAEEHALLAKFSESGDLEALGALYEKYMPLVYGVCLKYFKDDEKSKDAVMQIFEQLVTKLRVHEVTNFKSWLYSLARNYCLMAIRSDSKHDFVNIEDHFMEKDVFMHLDIDDLRENQLVAMERCMEHLPEEQRICINLFYLEQRSYKEVVDLTGFDINKVKSYIQNGKRNLKICIEKSGER
ncbi:MAG TPA: sigma-70 family RNA polymerase sigma factor [Sphingobacteriaceae bacterium]